MILLSSLIRNGGRCALMQQTSSQALAIIRTLTTEDSIRNQKLVIALGGNALLRRGEEMTMDNQRRNIASGMQSLMKVINTNSVTLVHGNGPQVGLLLLESAAYEKKTGLPTISLDVLDAETEGMIGYLLEQEIQSHLAPERGLVTVLSQIVCDPNDPAFANPTKFVGPIYTQEESQKLGLEVRPDGEFYRRVVPSPMPVKMVNHQMRAIRQLVDSDCVVICAGGGGIPVVEEESFHETGPSSPVRYRGIEAVIDKDRAAAMVGLALEAQGLIILTDVPGVATDFGKEQERFIQIASPAALEALLFDNHFPAGSMGPKVESAIDFVRASAGHGGWAAIGSLTEADKILAGEAGTRIITPAPENAGDDFITFYNQCI